MSCNVPRSHSHIRNSDESCKYHQYYNYTTPLSVTDYLLVSLTQCVLFLIPIIDTVRNNQILNYKLVITIGRCGSSMLRLSPNHGTLWLHNDDDEVKYK